MAEWLLPLPKAAHFGGPARMFKFYLNFRRASVNIMYYTYILLCIDKKRGRNHFYVGVTDNLRNRLQGHNSKGVKTTKSFDQIKLVYYEACLNKTDARKRELQLKTGFGRGYIKKRIENYLRGISLVAEQLLPKQ